MSETPIRKKIARRMAIASLGLLFLPLGANALYHVQKGGPSNYWDADWSSAGILPAPTSHQPAMVRVFAARTGRWKGIFAVHTWIVVKPRGARSYQRFDKVGWGSPIRVNNYPPDARWYSNTPRMIYAADGRQAEQLIPKLIAGVERYKFSRSGDYSIWPGPNSNTFTSCVLAGIPEMAAVLPPTAIGKNFPCEDRWFILERTVGGIHVSLRGLLGVRAGWRDGLEVNILGAVIGADFRRPALKLPGFGRIGMNAA
jgi:hypothetical protein